MSSPVSVIGAGLAGCTVAWNLHHRGQAFFLIENNPKEAGSLAAAGMLAPVTGKAFNPSWRIDEFYAPAREFYTRVEQELGIKLWYDYPVFRLFFDEKDREKFEQKRAENPELDNWVVDIVDTVPDVHANHGAVVWKGSGRVNVRAFVEATREKFGVSPKAAPKTHFIFTTGARGLVNKDPIELPHRSAKGEILTVRIPKLSQDQIISRGTWLVPTGCEDETFLCGANYEWDQLDNVPTDLGRETVEKGLQTLTNLSYEVIGHVAGVRPIVRRSEPVIGKVKDGYYLNGLGSKGTLYAPKSADYLANALLTECDVPTYLQI